jgi:serine/threonine-protein kinase
MSESAVKEILIGILPILEYIHAKRIVHRDIKPDNIILRDRDGKPVLIDFGAVKETMGTTITVSDNSARSIVIGTPGFMPSEQSAGRPMYASDLYSLGLTAVYLLTGKLPQEISVDFATGELMWQQYALNVSPTFIAILDKAIHPSARDRYSTATEMLQALEAGTISTVVEKKTLVISTEDNIGQQPPTRMEPTTPRQIVSQGMREWQKAVVMGGVIGACVVGGLWFIDAKEQKKPVWTSVIPSSQNSNTANDIAPASENLDRLNTQTPTVKPKVESTLPASVNTSPPDLTPPPNQQPSPAQAVENYYSNINSGQYQTAWNQLSPEYQSNKRLHPNGYSSYLNWWGEKVASVNIEQLSVLEANQDTATVNASLKYLMKTGRIVPNSVRLSLIWDAQNLRWVVRDAK